MEIERKYLVQKENLPFDLYSFPHRFIEQGYLCTDPVIRIRREGNSHELTYKSTGLMAREERNLPLCEKAYRQLQQKIEGHLISKIRYEIPLSDDLIVELDVFQGKLSPLMLAEVEFPDLESANLFVPPAWFSTEVTFAGKYHNSALSQTE